MATSTVRPTKKRAATTPKRRGRKQMSQPAPLIEDNTGLQVVFTQCRALGHEWKHKGYAGNNYRQPFNMQDAVGLRSQCTDCKTERIKWVTRSGEVINRYVYPDGYATHGEETRTAKQWRSSFVANLFS